MNNALALYILHRAWQHLMSDITVDGHSEAMDVITGFKVRAIVDGRIPSDQIDTVLDICAWEYWHEIRIESEIQDEVHHV